MWGIIPGVLRARLGVNEIITTLMLNYIALAWVQFWVFGPWSEGGFQQTATFPKEAWLPRLTDFGDGHPGVLRADDPPRDGVRAHRRSDRVVRPRAPAGATRSGSSATTRVPRATPGSISRRYIVVVFAISGALAGLAGMSEVAASVHRLQDRISPGYGFTAIIIAYLAQFGPWRVVVASILFGALILAGREIQPSGVPAMIQGIILFCLIVADVLSRYRVRHRAAPRRRRR